MLKKFELIDNDGTLVTTSYGLYDKFDGHGHEWILGIDRPEESISFVLTPDELMQFAELLFKMGELNQTE